MLHQLYSGASKDRAQDTIKPGSEMPIILVLDANYNGSLPFIVFCGGSLFSATASFFSNVDHGKSTFGYRIIFTRAEGNSSWLLVRAGYLLPEKRVANNRRSQPTNLRDAFPLS